MNPLTKTWSPIWEWLSPILSVPLLLIQNPLYTNMESIYDAIYTSQVTYEVSATVISIHNIIGHNKELHCPSDQA